MNHKWENNICVRCGIIRTMKAWKRRMAITDFPPYDHYQYGTSYYYGTFSAKDKGSFERPDCKHYNQTLKTNQ